MSSEAQGPVSMESTAESLLRREPHVQAAPAPTELPKEGETSLALLNVFILAMAPVHRLMARNRETATINAEVWFYQVGCIHTPQSQRESHEAEPGDLKALVTMS